MNSEPKTSQLYSSEVERNVLNSMLAFPTEIIDEVMGQLGKEDFFVPAHQIIWECLTQMHGKGQAVEMATAHQWLVDKGHAERIGSPAILAEIAATLATKVNVGSYVTILREKSTLRKLRAIANDILGSVEVLDKSGAEIADGASNALLGLLQRQGGGNNEHIQPVVDREIDCIETSSRSTSQCPITGIQTGMNCLDELTTGWHRGEFIVVAGRPGSGKSAILGNFAAAASSGKWDEECQGFMPGGYWTNIQSIEMPKSQFAARLLAGYMSLSYQCVRRRKLDEANLNKLLGMRLMFQDWNMTIDDDSSATISTIRAKARALKHAGKLDMICIDYLQRINTTMKCKGTGDRAVAVAEMARGLKSLARELDIVVIAACQFGRPTDTERPALHMLRESGDIENEADVVLGIHKYKDGDTICRELGILKQRNGASDIWWPVEFKGDHQRFYEKQNHPV